MLVALEGVLGLPTLLCVQSTNIRKSAEVNDQGEAIVLLPLQGEYSYCAS